MMQDMEAQDVFREIMAFVSYFQRDPTAVSSPD